MPKESKQLIPITESEPVVVGKFYPVKCAVLESKAGYIFYVPIIGESHRDPQFGQNAARLHYHIDGRFDVYFSNNDGKTNHAVWVDRIDYVYKVIGIEVRRRKCRMVTTGLDIGGLRNSGKFLYDAWYDSMVGKSCKGKKCPHMGTSMQEINGAWVCPLHNLIGDPDTEKIIVPKNTIAELV